ncbi:MAG: hypothetical protein DSM106950_04020 [Stigonema ocellatum SAG 48.90 = DSM 106950]|nr:hypothetical protein [Stigonema ocellatum SAG 48.90 = DSM 106950]
MYQPIRVRGWRNYSSSSVHEGKNWSEEVPQSRDTPPQASRVLLWLRRSDGFVEILSVITSFLVATLLTFSILPQVKGSVASKSPEMHQYIRLD